MANEDPWRDIPRPGSDGLLRMAPIAIAPTVSGASLHWARDHAGCALLTLTIPISERHEGAKPPKLAGISVEERILSEHQMIVCLRLLQKEHQGLFYSLCLDIVSEIADAESPAAARSTFLRRTQMWQDLLRKAAVTRLSRQEQMGLVGELKFMTEVMIPALGSAGAVRSWTGPDGRSKDFEAGKCWIEVKAYSAQGRREVHISSETQLDDAGEALLYLYTIPVSSSPDATTGGETLTELVAQLLDQLKMESPDAANQAYEQLVAAGFSIEHEYEDRWITMEPTLYRVGRDFPCIRRDMLPVGPHSVQYLLPLEFCDGWQSDFGTLLATLRGDTR